MSDGKVQSEPINKNLQKVAGAGNRPDLRGSEGVQDRAGRLRFSFPDGTIDSGNALAH